LPYIEDSIAASDNLRLYVRRHEADRPRAEIVLVHGFGEHSGRYAALTEHLIEAGYTVTAYDHRGHGQSEGLRGHVESFSEYEDDLDRIAGWVRSRAEDRVLLLIGHSMGGLVTLRYSARTESRNVRALAGAVISAPLIGVATPVPQHKLIIGLVAAKVAPRMRLDNEINSAVLSRDPEIGRAYAADPLVHRKVSARWYAEAVKAMREVVELAPRIKTPLLVMHGSADRLASVDATKRFYEQIGSADKELVVYEGWYHELFNEPDKYEVFNRVTSWLAKRIDS